MNQMEKSHKDSMEQQQVQSNRTTSSIWLWIQLCVLVLGIFILILCYLVLITNVEVPKKTRQAGVKTQLSVISIG